MLDLATVVIVGLGLCSVPFAFIEYVVSRARREACRRTEAT